MKYIIKCPNCECEGDLEEVNFQYFQCKCGEGFEIERAMIEEVE